MTDKYYEYYDCSQSSESKSVKAWSCSYNGKDIFEKDKQNVGTIWGGTLTFGSNFAKLGNGRYSFETGGTGSKYCKGTKEGKIAYWLIIVLVVVVLGALLVCLAKTQHH